MKITLPWPPSVNHYWRTIMLGGSPRTLVSKEGRQYQQTVAALLFGVESHLGPLAVSIEAFPPDKRRRDLDNICKSLLDAMERAGVYEDDSQIVELLLRKHSAEKPGRVEVAITAAETKGKRDA